MEISASVLPWGEYFIPTITVDGDARFFAAPRLPNHVRYTDEGEALKYAMSRVEEIQNTVLHAIQAMGFITPLPDYSTQDALLGR
jgi:hypothetical protein